MAGMGRDAAAGITFCGSRRRVALVGDYSAEASSAWASAAFASATSADIGSGSDARRRGGGGGGGGRSWTRPSASGRPGSSYSGPGSAAVQPPAGAKALAARTGCCGTGRSTAAALLRWCCLAVATEAGPWANIAVMAMQ